MSYCEISVPILQGTAFSAQLNAALQVARTARSGLSPCIKALFIPAGAKQEAEEMSLSISDLVADDDITFEAADSAMTADEVLAKANFDAWRGKHGLQSGRSGQAGGTISARWRHGMKPLEAEIVSAGRLSDLLVLARPQGGEAAAWRAFEAAVFDTGRPTLFVSDDVPENILAHAVVAWNGSLEATRAIAAAMPLLERAERVSIFSADQADAAAGGPDVRDHLAAHGIHAGKLHPVTEEKSVGAALLKVAAYESATLLVMGAYGHSRVRERLFDGVTWHVVRHSAVPVLMIH